MSLSQLSLENIEFSYGSKKVIEDLNLQLGGKKTYCLVGASGSGKTTCLRLMNGLLLPQMGSVKLEGQELTKKNSVHLRRSMGYAIQGSGLFPHLNIGENLGIVAKREAWSKEKIEKRSLELLELFSLPSEKSFLKKKISQVSGGQKQRIGLARALFMRPQIMLMDEPFSALDPITRKDIQEEFLKIQSSLDLTIVMVTHDLAEAFKMGDEIILLNQGKIEQKGKPSHFLLNPQTPYVEEFMASHSPGSLLKEIFLYSVVNSQIWTSLEKENGLELKNLETGETKKIANLNEMLHFLSSTNQKQIYWVDKEGHYRYQETLEDNQQFSQSLGSHQNILEGMQSLLENKTDQIPVKNKQGELIGVFSKKALEKL